MWQITKHGAEATRVMKNAVEKNRLWQSLPVITLLALTVRLFFMAFLYRNTWNDFRDHLLFGFEIGRIARSIAAGHGYSNPFSAETGPTAWVTPVYPYLLAATFKLFGIYSKASALVILGLNCLFSSLVCIPIFSMAQFSFGRSVAIAACWIWALLPYSIYISSSFVWETCLSSLLLAVLFFWTLKLKKQPGNRWAWLGYGALWGFAALSNASLLSLFPFLAGWSISPLWRSRRMWLSTAFLMALACAAILLPWLVRNYRAFHQIIPLRDNFWLEVWIGNDGYTLSQSDDSPHPSVTETSLDEYARLGEIRFMQEKRRQAIGFIAEHPRFFAVMCLRRFVYLWTAFWNLDPSNLDVELHYPGNVFLTFGLTVLMLVGIWQAFRQSRDATLPYLLVLAVYPLIFYFTHPEIRYRHLIDPEIIILAALGARFLLFGPKAIHIPTSQDLSAGTA
jgi:4-amino-4-deoxy-L-arabinose transferase-like glycosyltransferase